MAGQTDSVTVPLENGIKSFSQPLALDKAPFSPTAAAHCHQATSSLSNGHDMTSIPEMSDEDRTKLLPEIPPNTFPFGELLSRTVQTTYTDLLDLAETLPSASNDERKKQLLNFCFAKRKLFTKLLVLLRASSKSKDIMTCQRVHAFIDHQDGAFSRTADDLFAIHSQMRVAKIANYDIQTAVDVLTTGTYQRLPKSLKAQLVSEEPLTADEVSRTKERLNDLIRMRLTCEEVVPAALRHNMKIENGYVLFKVPGEFSVTLTMSPGNSEQPWTLVDLQILAKSTSTGYGGSLPSLQPTQLQAFKDASQRHLADDKSSYWLIVRLYEFIHKFCLTYQLHILSSQASYLCQNRWMDHLQVEKQELVLKLNMWHNPSASNAVSYREYYQLRISAEYIPTVYPDRSFEPMSDSDGLQKVVLESLSQMIVNSGKNNGLKISLIGILGSTVRDIDIPDMIKLNTESLDIEELLLSITDYQSRIIICAMRDELLTNASDSSAGSLVHSAFTSEHVQMSMGIEAETGNSTSPTIKSMLPAASLLVMYRPESWVRLSVNPRTGIVIASLADASGLGSLVGANSSTCSPISENAPAGSTLSKESGNGLKRITTSIDRNLKIVEQQINANVRNTKQAILYLRRATTITQIETMALYLGLEVADFAHIGTDSPLKHLQTDKVRLTHLRFPGKDDNVLVIAAGTPNDIHHDNALHSQVSDTVIYSEDAEFYVWIMSLKPSEHRTKKPEFQIIPLSPADVPGVLDSTDSLIDVDTSFLTAKLRLSKTSQHQSFSQAWPRIDLPVLSKIQTASSNLFAFAKLTEQLDLNGLTYQILVKNIPGYIPKGQTHVGDIHIARLNPKVVLSVRELFSLYGHAAFKSTHSSNSSTMDPGSNMHIPNSNIYVYLEPAKSLSFSAKSQSPTAKIDAISTEHHTHRIVAKMRLPDRLLSLEAHSLKISEYIEYDGTSQTITFQYHSVNEYIECFITEFLRVISMIYLTLQLKRYTKALENMNVKMDFFNLLMVNVQLFPNTVMQIKWLPQHDSQTNESGFSVWHGEYAASFQHNDGSPDELMVIADLFTAILNKTKEIFPLIQLLHRVAPLVSLLEHIRQRRVAFGQTGVVLKILSLTHFRIVFPYFSQLCGIEFVYERPGSFMMFDASMLDYAAELGLGSLAKVGLGIFCDDSIVDNSIDTEHTLRPLPEYIDMPAVSVPGMDQMRPPRIGLLYTLGTRVAQELADSATATTDPPRSSRQVADTPTHSKHGSIVVLPHGILCTFSMIDTVMVGIEGYIDVMCASDLIFSYLKTQPVTHSIHEEQHCRILFATESSKAALTCHSNGRWGFVIAATERTHDNKAAVANIPDSKAWLDRLNHDVNAIPIPKRNSLQWLKTVVHIAMLPDIPLRELMSVTRVSNSLNNTKPLALEWILQSPPDAPPHIPAPGEMSFIFDRDLERMRLLI
ncbi:hypothetical protein BDEG_21480 [Batrachochytrium dendrobatidis JEL423]|uniref:Mediator of RNA polymerase II transcription subunit 14 n=1 Tax=Batrachochytrium dendrobatidis (strain JEL423) TaxID=403673 RepID=A0A177WCP6_BATDL|nr:hypothetical protein BDEG_21480 [Batrachochytrium dendrobatidis JEL423]